METAFTSNFTSLSHFLLPSPIPLMPCKHSVLQPLPGTISFLYCHVSNSIVLQGPSQGHFLQEAAFDSL